MSRPTTTSAALAALLSLAAAAALARSASVAGPAVLSGAGAVVLAVALWAVGRERYRAAATFLASLLLVPIGVGAFAATAGTVLVAVGQTFPVATLADVPPAVVQLAARSLVVVGVTLAVLGAAALPRHVLERSTVERMAGVTLATAVPPFLVGSLLAAAAILTAVGDGPGAVVGDALGAFWPLVFTPAPTRVHLTTFTLVMGSGLLALGGAIRALPLAELATGDASGVDPRSGIGLLERLPLWSGIALLLAMPVVGAIEATMSPAAIATSLPAGLYSTLVGLTTAPGLRMLAWWLFVLGGTVVVVVWALRVAARRSTDRVAASVAPVVTGVLFVAGAFAFGRQATDVGIEWLATTLPAEIGTVAREVSRGTVEFLGPASVVLLLTTLVLILVAAGVGVLWIAMAVGYLGDRTGSVALAAAGPFLAAAAAGTLGADPVLVLAGLVAALVAWDVGEFGATLADEVGHRTATRRTELVHAGGALAVGTVGAGLAWGLADLSGGPLLFTGETVVVGLLAGMAGLVFVLIALR